MSTIHFHARHAAVTTKPSDLHAVIERIYVDDAEGWKPISTDEFLRRTEWAGFWPRGTALDALRVGQVRTPFALFRLRVTA